MRSARTAASDALVAAETPRPRAALRNRSSGRRRQRRGRWRGQGRATGARAATAARAAETEQTTTKAHRQPGRAGPPGERPPGSGQKAGLAAGSRRAAKRHGAAQGVVSVGSAVRKRGGREGRDDGREGRSPAVGDGEHRMGLLGRLAGTEGPEGDRQHLRWGRIGQRGGQEPARAGQGLRRGQGDLESLREPEVGPVEWRALEVRWPYSGRWGG